MSYFLGSRIGFPSYFFDVGGTTGYAVKIGTGLAL